MFNAALLVVAIASSNAYNPVFHNAFEAASDCPAGRQLAAEISYGPGDTGSVDVTEWANIWGRTSLLVQPVPWPGVEVAPIFVDFDRTTYVSAHFSVPDGTPQNSMGWLTYAEYNYGRDLVASISTSCGDFNPSSAACHEVATSGMPIMPWRTGAGNFCVLTPGVDYYLNFKAADPSGSCTPGPETCDVQLGNEFSEP